MRKKIAGLAVGLIALFAAVWYWHISERGPSNQEASDAGTEFVLVDAADRSLDGAPALALTFSLPLDTRQSYDKYIRVFEMPAVEGAKQPSNSDAENEDDEGSQPAKGKTSVVSTSAEDTDTKGGKVVEGAWVVGDNPRLLYFPHIKPQTRYVVQVQVGLPAKNGKKLGSESRYSVLSAPVSPAY